MRHSILLALALVTACSADRKDAPPFTGGSGNGNGDGGLTLPAEGGLGGEVPDGGTDDPTGDCESGKYIYVVDNANVLYAFDPTNATKAAFRKIGTIACGASAGRPNSMAISRDGYAYVSMGTGTTAFTCTGVYKVRTSDAGCVGPTSFKCGDAGFRKFGMGFATDAVGGKTDSLFIASSNDAKLGRIDVVSGAATALGAVPNQGGELTGNQRAELWGYFPDQDPPEVHHLDKNDGKTIAKFTLNGLPTLRAGNGGAWAFAYWGGEFYVFYKVSPIDASSNVWKMTADGKVSKYISLTGIDIVGAGVSTCAPVTVK
jgi:hypothetical protein